VYLGADGGGGFFPFRPPGTGAVMARTKSRPVVLSPAERQMLSRITRTGSHPAQQVRRARILLELDENSPGPVPPQEVVAVRAGVRTDTVVEVSKACADSGGDIEATITRRKRLTPPVEPKVTGDIEARVIALACSQPPKGYDRWSLRLLEKHAALVADIPDLDHPTIGRVLKKHGFALT
jgi:hypothetical protein